MTRAPDQAVSGVEVQLSEPRWYAIHTRARHEKKVNAALSEAGIESFLPLTRRIHTWRDRRKTVDLPLFPCYSFVRIAESSPKRLVVLQTAGVLGFVGAQHRATPIPDNEVEQVRRVTEQE